MVRTSVLLICVTVGSVLLGFWLTGTSEQMVVKMVPDMDGSPAGPERITLTPQPGSHYVLYSPVPESTGGGSSWPAFRGEDRSNSITDSIPLADSWGPSGPRELWSRSLGEGHAAPVVYKGTVYILDYHEETQQDILRAFSLETGTEYWQLGYRNPIKRNHGFSRSIPAVTERFVVSIGPMGQVMCADRISGELIWGLDLSSEFGTEPPLWYGAQSPLINQGSVILAPAGPDVLMAAIDLESGELLWTVPNPNGYAMSHSSIIPVQINGTKQFVYSGLGGMTGVSTEGEVLWMVPLNLAVIAPSPVFLPPDRIFQTAGYGAGSSMVRVDSDGPDTARVLWSRTPREGLACEQQTPILFRDRMFGILPKDAGTLREQFVCADTEGQILWTSGMELRFGLGPWIVADNKFFILGDTGILYMADALSDSWKLLDQAMVLNGVDAWGPLAIADGRLLARDSLTLVCLDLRP